MKTLKEYIDWTKEEEYVYEMANISPKSHKFGVNVTLHILQLGDKQLPHGPRIKIMKGNNELFIITLPKTGEPRVIGKTTGVKFKDVKTLIDVTKYYREVWLRLWYNNGMSETDALEFVEAINTNNHKKIEEIRKEFPNIK